MFALLLLAKMVAVKKVRCSPSYPDVATSCSEEVSCLGFLLLCHSFFILKMKQQNEKGIARQCVFFGIFDRYQFLLHLRLLNLHVGPHNHLHIHDTKMEIT